MKFEKLRKLLLPLEIPGHKLSKQLILSTVGAVFSYASFCFVLIVLLDQLIRYKNISENSEKMLYLGEHRFFLPELLTSHGTIRQPISSPTVGAVNHHWFM